MKLSDVLWLWASVFAAALVMVAVAFCVAEIAIGAYQMATQGSL